MRPVTHEVGSLRLLLLHYHPTKMLTCVCFTVLKIIIVLVILIVFSLLLCHKLFILLQNLIFNLNLMF